MADDAEMAAAAADPTVGSLHWADLLVVVLYFVIVLAVGLLVSGLLQCERLRRK